MIKKKSAFYVTKKSQHAKFSVLKTVGKLEVAAFIVDCYKVLTVETPYKNAK